MPDIPLIPLPRFCRRNNQTFRLTPETVLVADTAEAAAAVTLLQNIILQDTGLALPITDRPGEGSVIRFSGGAQTAEDEVGFRNEAYRLTITDAAVELVADTPDGLAAGVQTLRQLLPEGPGTLPGLEIRDEPQYRWRGMLLDSSRHFFTVDEVCRLVELMALHKFNVLHWHLTDDQGWRLESARFPLLTRIGSRRACTQTNHNTDRPILYDDQPHGGFYTRDDVRRVIDFAARRGIRIMPEIDLPGHAEALLAAYPEFGNLPGYRYQVRERWGISRHTLNVAQETIAAMQSLFEEVVELFPWKWIHIGGDEVDPGEWAASRDAQNRMAELGLHSERELQSYFLTQICRRLTELGRRPIGWDEILEGGPPAGAAVMCWHGNEGGLQAARLGLDAVMADSAQVYLNHYQADPATEPLSHGYELPIALVYRFAPVPHGLDAETARHILGGQGALWTEYIPNMKHLEYMMFPRACALAERLWLPPDQCDYPDFLLRLRCHRQLLNRHRVNAHILPL